MCGLDYVFALVLLTAPGGDVSTITLPAWTAHLSPALKELALHAELLDPREAGTLLIRTECLRDDLNLLRRRTRELAQAPVLVDVQRFPPRDVIEDQIKANRTYRQHLEARRAVELSQAWSLRTVIQETEQLYQIFDTLRDAQSSHVQLPLRRLALQKLRELLGEEAYFGAILPPCMPIWRFTRVD